MNKKTFCSAPWTQIRIDWNGEFRPCCEINVGNSKFVGQKTFSMHESSVDQYMTSDYLQYVRQSLQSGDYITECGACWDKEKFNVQSLRQILNNTATRNRGNQIENTWIKSFVDKSAEYRDYHLISADIKLSNVCNFSCAMCDPVSSSRIHSEWKSQQSVAFVQEKLINNPTYFDDITRNYQNQKGYQHLKDILKNKLQHLKLLGGEPLLDRECFRILESVSQKTKQEITLHFVTNGSVNLLDAIKRLQGYKEIGFTVSLEGIGLVQDYARNGSDWSQIETNILQAQDHNIRLGIHHTLQALTVPYLDRLLSWCSTHSLPISFGVVRNPDYLGLGVLPIPLRNLTIDRLDKIADIEINQDPEHDEIGTVKNIQNLILSGEFDATLYTKFIDYLHWYERNASVKLKNICPEFYAC
jgi:Radical SAM superfamily/4Fe-4S single cluster domain